MTATLEGGEWSGKTV